LGGALRLVAGGRRERGEHRDAESGAHAARVDPDNTSLTASERQAAARAAWREEVATVRPAALVCLDQPGRQLGYTPTRARAPRGQRADATAPATRGSPRPWSRP